jgi:hypothetical protein
MTVQAEQAHAWGFNAILGSTITGIILMLSIITTIWGLTGAVVVVFATILFAGFVGSIFFSETVRDYLNAHSLARRFGHHAETVDKTQKMS